MPHRIEEGRQIHINHARLVLHNRLGHPANRLMGCPFRAIPIRSVPTIRLKDRVQQERERSLHHTVPNRRDPSDADSPAAFRNLHVPVPHRSIGLRDQFVP